MKSLVILVVASAFAAAEPPLSHSYLPPSPASRGPGYPQGGSAGVPQIVAARSFDQAHGHSGNGLARSASYDHARASQSQGYDENSAAGAFGRNAIDASSEPANYNFGYMVNDFSEGTDFGHHEERLEERAQGEYHVVLPDGRKQTVSYEADERGFKPQISYQDTEDLARNHGNGYGVNDGHDTNTGY